MTLPFVCPRCRAPLSVDGTDAGHIECGACEATYPRVNGIPLLMPEPDAVLETWSTWLAQFDTEMDESIRHVALQLLEGTPGERTRARLRLVLDSLPQHRERIVELFGAAGITPRHSSGDGSTRATSDAGSVLAYYTLIHRDWGWSPEVDEVTPAVEALVSALPPGFRLGRTLVLGAGTARLAWQLGQRLNETETILALDVNPLPYLVTARLLRGETPELFELPGHPRRSSYAAVSRRLAPPGPPPPGLVLAFADALAPPVLPASFDTVITPWFVDQVPKDLRALPPMIRSLLRDGGSWLNQGPFVYDPARTDVAHRYCADEFLELLNDAGFEVTKASYDSVPYLASPVSSQARQERVLTSHAKKRDVRASAPPTEPEWLRPTGATLPVPAFPGSVDYTAPHPTIGKVLGLVDGQRSVAEITARLVQAGHVADDGAAETAVRACLKVLWNALGQSPR